VLPPPDRTNRIQIDPADFLRLAGSWNDTATDFRAAASRLDRLAGETSGLPSDVVARVTAVLPSAAQVVRDLAAPMEVLARNAAKRADIARSADDPIGAMLALDFAPEIRFAEGEENWLEDPRYYSKTAEFDSGRFDLPDNDNARRGNNERAKLLYEWDPVANSITYHLFYAYNNGHASQNHEGDWERVTVQLGDDYQPRKVFYSAHGDKHNERDWQGVEKNSDGRPIVYSAKGSHANAPHEGSWPTEVPGLNDRASNGKEKVDLATKLLVDITREPYYGKGYVWGEKGFPVVGPLLGTDGPSGPPKPLTDEDAQPRDQAKPLLNPRFITPRVYP
jgi:hypothetical protein